MFDKYHMELTRNKFKGLKFESLLFNEAYDGMEELG